MSLHLVDEGSGTPVVLLHAYPCDHSMWDAQAADLVAAGYRVVRPDLPGFGDSPSLTVEPGLGAFADAVFDALDGCRVSRFVLVGLSMGGYVAMEMLRQQPDRVLALGLVDTKAGADSPEAVQTRLATAQRAETDGSLAGLAQGMLGGLLGTTTLAERPEVVERTAAFIVAASGAGAAWAMRAMAARPDSAATLAGFDRPGLVVMGEEDALSSRAEHELMAAALPQGRLVTIEASGHLSAIERPEHVSAALLGFLQQV